ncbi:MAG TPA: hypothetical protein EYP29_05080 [Thermoplasmata archaeon]|nr:hypothetical protein [Thermoplasmata archaeon]
MKKIEFEELKATIGKLEKYIEENQYIGYDPYDALNSPILRKSRSKNTRLFFTLLLRKSPINLRKILAVEKGINPKAMGLFLSGYANLYRAGLVESKEKMHWIFEWLKENYSKGYSGYCWGYNFPWQNRERLLKENTPTVVNTSYVGHAILDYHEVAGEREALDIARSACDFITKDLNITENEKGICFSYTPVEKNIVHNASVLGASLLARVYSYTKEEELLNYATKAMNFTVSYQHKDGRWDYSLDAGTGKPRVQTDWHQGFIIDSLLWYIEALELDNQKYVKAVEKGAEFYKKQFTSDGRGYWRYPRLYPINIHNQAQGIITFSKLAKINSNYLNFAENIANWTIKNLWSPHGYFYYQRHRFFTNRIPYMRWSQAWMFLALSSLIWRVKREK